MHLPYSNTQIKHQNPGAEMPLILPVHLICNTSDEVIFANIKKNSAKRKNWLKLSDAHEKKAIICGSGPSLADHLDLIKKMKTDGGVVFALNGAARFLEENEILADYQVLIDAREETAALVGPAAHHLFASQVNPACFKAQPKARLWHLQVEGMDDYLPKYEDDYCLVGGAASVGNTATCLAYAMGFRELHLFGYDSCHRGDNSHAFEQKMNDGDPCAMVAFNGKEYKASLTMKLQAERFPDTAYALMQMGCSINLHGEGLLQAIWSERQKPITEQEKYQKLWSMPEYRITSPGENVVDEFIAQSGVSRDDIVIDIGCGTGRAAVAISEKVGCKVKLIDFADNCLDDNARGLDIAMLDISQQPIGLRGTIGFCCDVLEHIPTDLLDFTVKNILKSVKKCFFQISTVDDVCGALIGHPLHLSVYDAEWWQVFFERVGAKIESKVVKQDCVLLIVNNEGN